MKWRTTELLFTDLDQCLSSREEINGKLRLILDEATDKWGVKVLRVDVKNINPRKT